MLNELNDAIKAVGYTPPHHIGIGKVTRFSTNNKQSDRSGWVLVFDDGKGAVFGCWRSGEQHQWQAHRDYTPSITEQEAMRQQFEEAKRKATLQRDEDYAVAAREAKSLFDAAVVVKEHDYLTDKGINPNMAKVFGGKLLIPVYDELGNIQSLQSIFSDGAKRFHAGGKMQGGHCWIGDPIASETLLIAEGFATADSLYQATNLAVCIAFNAGNLKAVTDMLKIQYDKKRIVICADNDVSGIGIDKANLCGVDVVYPDIHGDFNDVMKQQGIDAVRDIVFGKIKHEGLFVSLTEMMANVTTPQWLIKGLLERGSMNLLFGEPGAGKSLFAMDWAFCGAIGKDWHGHKIKDQLNTLVIMGEGLRGATFRFKALMKKYNGSTINGDRIRFSRRSINLLDAREAENICKLVEDMDFAPDIIIIDTLHRNMVGDENSSEDMAMYFKSIELLARKLNAAIITVHHSGHGDKGRSRGSSSIKAAMDAEFCVTKDGKDVVKFACTKSKDFGAGSDMNFTIKEVDLDGEMFYDADEDKQITSVYLEYEGVTKKEKELTENQQKTIDSLIETLEINGKKDCVMDDNGGYHTTVHYDEWYPFIKEVFKGAENVSKDFGRCKNSLLKQKLIGNNGNYWWLV